VKNNGLIHYISQRTRKNRTVQFPKPEGPVLHVMAIFQILDIPVPKPDVPVFTGYFLTTSFWEASIKASPSLLWRLLVPPMKILIS
jgi:hypothetical protein